MSALPARPKSCLAAAARVCVCALNLLHQRQDVLDECRLAGRTRSGGAVDEEAIAVTHAGAQLCLA